MMEAEQVQFNDLLKIIDYSGEGRQVQAGRQAGRQVQITGRYTQVGTGNRN